VGTRHAGSPSEEGSQTSHRTVADEASEPLTAERYPPRVRLGRGVDLSQCWEAGRRVRLRYLDIAWRPNAQGHARMGIIVPRFRHNAVARNRLRRRVREILRRDLLGTLPAVDMVIRARPAAYAAPFAALRAELAQGATRIPR
jgi:ribonuclease P protein component